MIVEGGKGQPGFALLTLGISILAKIIHLDPAHISFLIEKVALMNPFLECCLKSPTRMRGGDLNLRSTTAVPPCLTHRYIFLVHKNKLTLDVTSRVPKSPYQVPTTTWPPSCSFGSERVPHLSDFLLTITHHISFQEKGQRQWRFLKDPQH